MARRAKKKASKRRGGKSPTRVLKDHLDELGLAYDDCETRITRTIKKDLFGIFDMIVLDGPHTYGVQVTSAANLAARHKKILDSEGVRLWNAPERMTVLVGVRDDGTLNCRAYYYPLQSPQLLFFEFTSFEHIWSLDHE